MYEGLCINRIMPSRPKHEWVGESEENNPYPEQKWMCDNCGMSFESFDEACRHESSCEHRKVESSLNENTLATLNDRFVLNEFDFLLCRQVEVFAVSQEDMKDNTFTEGTVIGQVGLRCIHCSRSPLATAGYATVFPGSVASTGASLRMMAEHHFSKCSMTPVKIKEKLEISNKKEQKDEDTLKDFCANEVSKRLGLVNLFPSKTGIVFSRSTSSTIKMEDSSFKSSPESRSYAQADPRFEYRNFSSSPSTSRPKQSSPIRHRGTAPPQYNALPLPQPPYPPAISSASHVGSRGMTVYNPQNFPPPSRYDYSHSHFFRDQLGWACRHCSSIPFHFRAPNSFYPYHETPPPSFIESHLQLCSGGMMYHAPSSSRYNYNISPQSETVFPSAAVDYLSSVAAKDSSLVLDEDKVLLSDYFFYLIHQLKFCRFVESDRKTRGGKRENVKVGFGGLECRHCAIANPASSRKFFWSNVDRLANSFAEIPSHVLKCKNCPERIKSALQELKLRHPEQMAKLPRGSQKVFFRRMWRRVHVESTEVSEETQQLSPNTKTQPTSIIGIPLAIAEDKDWLSDTDYFVRRQLEVFCATEEDVFSAQSDRKFPIGVGQVGIRCIHCNSSEQGARDNAVNFPHSIDGIYEVVRELQKLHLESCPNLPQDVKQEMSNLKTSTSLSSVLRRYYVLAAKALGLVDSTEGIRMGGESLPLSSNQLEQKTTKSSLDDETQDFKRKRTSSESILSSDRISKKPAQHTKNDSSDNVKHED